MLSHLIFRLKLDTIDQTQSRLKKARTHLESALESNISKKEDLPSKIYDPFHLNNSELQVLNHLMELSATKEIKALRHPGKGLTRVQEIHTFIEDIIQKQNQTRNAIHDKEWFQERQQILIRREVRTISFSCKKLVCLTT